MPKTRNYGLLLEDPDISLWYDELRRGSIRTARSYLGALGLFSERIGVRPQEYIKLDLTARRTCQAF